MPQNNDIEKIINSNKPNDVNCNGNNPEPQELPPLQVNNRKKIVSNINELYEINQEEVQENDGDIKEFNNKKRMKKALDIPKNEVF